jgi:hypothetical protein
MKFFDGDALVEAGTVLLASLRFPRSEVADLNLIGSVGFNNL